MNDIILVMHYVYILEDSIEKNYVGYSHNLKERIDEHKYGSVNTTKQFTDAKLVWYCAFKNKKKALEFEKYLKRGSGHAFMKKRFL